MSAETPRPILEEDLHAYVDDALDAARRREVQDYLDRHADAARLVAAFRAQRVMLRSGLAGIADEPVPPQLNLERLIAERRPRREPRWRMAAAMLLALGIGAFGGWAVRDGLADGSGTGVAALAREASNSYEVYAADPLRPVEMGPGERAEFAGWVSERLKRQISVLDLTASGYRYIGGRLVATEHGPAGLFLYDDAKGTRLALLVRPMSIDKDTPMMKHSEGAVSGYAWADRGLGYSVVGAARPETLHPLADEMRRQVRNTL